MADKIAVVQFVETVRLNQTETRTVRAAADKCEIVERERGIEIVPQGKPRVLVPWSNVRFCEYEMKAAVPVKAA